MNACILSAIFLLFISTVYATDCLTYGIVVNATAHDTYDNITVSYNVVPSCWYSSMASDSVYFYLSDSNGGYMSDGTDVSYLANIYYPEPSGDTVFFDFSDYFGDKKYICVGVGATDAYGCTENTITIGEPVHWAALVLVGFIVLLFFCSPCLVCCVISVKVVIIVGAFMFCISLSQKRHNKYKQTMLSGPAPQAYTSIGGPPAFNQASVPIPTAQQPQQHYPTPSYQPATYGQTPQTYAQAQYNPYGGQAPPPPQGDRYY
ncbi:hypothetical protein J8273_8902 [Carpediemonas membranifera]|uniref:Uncharacterized protein n=1 Tax=Carpediemonas membranifera TaxID=201153 RepID=A0A8J6AZC1_9EUKA|nr:hypothetical protein J8273_8902 [Carpediemonas membranifera]|eukprot:KAG9389609.1 hypothetical protein J8273_8902 [Carpediemonas membranifera]